MATWPTVRIATYELALDGVCATAGIEERFRSRGIVMAEKNRVQAFFPEGVGIGAVPLGTQARFPTSGPDPLRVAAGLAGRCGLRRPGDQP